MTPEGQARLDAARRKERVPVAEFVHAWVNHPSLVEIGAALDISVQAVQARAKTLRKTGVALPERVTGSSGVRGGTNGRVAYSADTVANLNKLIAEAEAARAGVTAPAPATEATNESASDVTEPASDDGDDIL